MSQFYDQASLVVVPSGYKAGTVYAQKPLTTDGQLTFTRTGDTATRVNSAGLIEKVRTNLILQSNTFSNASWTKTNSTVTSGQAGYDGTNNAFLITGTGASDDKIVQSVTTTGLITASVYAKAGNVNFIIIAIGGVATWFNLSSGAVGTNISALNPKIESAGNGYYRCSISVVNASSTNFELYLANSNGNTTTAAGNYILLQNSQVETGDVATPYIPTTTAAVSVGPVANVPRLDYLGSTCPRLLLEPQRTNLWTFSEDLNLLNFRVNVTVSSNVTTSPDGYTNADKLAETAATGNHFVYGAKFNITSGTVYTMSFFAKQGERRYLVFQGDGQAGLLGNASVYDLQNGTVHFNANTTNTITPYGNGWYRITVTATATGTSTAYPFFAINQSAANSFQSYAGTAGNGFFLFGFQGEAGAYATSYIPTLAASATRGGDDCGTTSLQSASLIGATAGTFFIETIKTDAAIWFNQRIFLTDTTTRSLLMDTSGGQIRLRTWDASSAGATITTSGLANGLVKYLIKWDGTNIKVFANGVLVGSSAQPSYAYTTYSALESTSFSNNTISQLLFFPTALSDTDCIALTA